jgi:hypothetical protein
MRKRALLIAAALALLAFAGGCGGSSDEGSSTGTATGLAIKTSSLDKAEFIEQAGKACGQARKELIDRLTAYDRRQNSKNAEKEGGLAGLTKAVVIPTVKTEIAAIRKLGAPAGDEGEIEAFLAAEQEAVDSLAKLRHIVSRIEMERHFVKSAEIARAYGLDACANGE